MRAGVALVTAIAILAAPASALAQCKADVDCKGNRVCERGRCVNLQDERVRVRRAPPPPAEPGWSLPAAIVGTVSGAAIAGLTLFSEFLDARPSTSAAFELSAFVLLAAAAPITFAGGRSARNQAAVNGISGLRIAGWIFYGVTLAVSGILLLTRAAKAEIPDGFVSGTGAAGALTMAFFSIDAVVGWHEAEELAAHDMGWGPIIGMAVDDDGGRVPTIGASARF